jgi:hypothetical protein
MRRVILLISLFIYSGVVTIAQSQVIDENLKDSEFGLVYFIRGKGHAGSATAFSALIDDKRVCQLNNRKYSVHEVPPGPHEFKAQFGGKKGKKKAEVAPIDVEAGGTYYIQMVRQSTFMVNDVIAQEITRNSALRLIEDDKIEKDRNCKAED